MRFLRLVLLFLVLQFTVACGGTVGNATLLSTRPIHPEQLLHLRPSSKVVRGEVMVWVYFAFHRKFLLDEAIEDALKKVPGAVALTDVTISEHFWWAGVGRGGFIVEGRPLLDTNDSEYTAVKD